MTRKISKSFIDALVEVIPLIVCSMLCSMFICTVLGLSLSFSNFPVLLFYTTSIAVFVIFFVSLRIYREVNDRIDCYMQAAVSGTFVGLLNCEILSETGVIYGWLGDPYWEYKLVFLIAASFWHGLIMVLLIKSLKRQKAANIRLQPQYESLD